MPIPIAVIGHKDHGKSTLIGRLLLDTSSIKKSRLKEIKETDKAWGRKFELAHLVDSFFEEREKEMTIDTTRVLVEWKNKIYELIDVPGHEELIDNMITGASNAKLAILVVDVKEGIKEQTIQHLEIAKILGIEKVVALINKMDKVRYQKEKFESVKEKLEEILKKIGYFSTEIKFLPVSALKGENLLKKSKKMFWYKDLSLMEFLEKEIKLPEPFSNLPLQFLVQDVYNEGGERILIGKIEAGRLKRGQKILFLPGNKKSKVKLIKDSEINLKEAVCGQNVGIILEKNFDTKRGAVGVTSKSNLKVSNILSGEIFWIEKPSQRHLILECGTARARRVLLKPQEIQAKQKSRYKIQLEKPIVFDPKNKTILGKIVLKDKGKIVGIGNII